MAEFGLQFGWCLLGVAAIFALGLVPRFARLIYPGSPGLAPRLAAPALFVTLAVACFAGVGFAALVATLTVGTPISVGWRWRNHRRVARTA